MAFRTHYRDPIEIDDAGIQGVRWVEFAVQTLIGGPTALRTEFAIGRSLTTSQDNLRRNPLPCPRDLAGDSV